MINVSSEFHAAARAITRKPKIKVEVTWTDPVSDSTINVIAYDQNASNINNGDGDSYWANQVANGRDQASFKWASCDGLKPLTTAPHPAPGIEAELEKHEIGYWGSDRSGSDGAFSNHPLLQVEFAARGAES